jgi:hypothetical protein
MGEDTKIESFILQPKSISEEDLDVLNRIEDMALKDLSLGYDPRALQILDDENASAKQINDIKQLISKDIIAALFQVGSSFHYHKLRIGSAPDFYDLVIRLGTTPSKVYILAMSLFAISNDEKIRELSAKSFATSMLSGMFAQERHWKEALIRKAELMGLFIEMGKVIMLLYRHKMEETHPGEPIFDNLFFDKYNSYFGGKIVEKFGLPEFLYDVLAHPDYLSFDEESVTVPGLVFSTYCHVERSFGKYRKLLIQSIMPNEEGNPPVTTGTLIQERFNAVGLGKYLEIRPVYLPCDKKQV